MYIRLMATKKSERIYGNRTRYSVPCAKDYLDCIKFDSIQ